MNTPFGLYKWLVMLMGLCNSPAVHQHHVFVALCKLIGKISHIYLDNIIIWLDLLEDHEQNVASVLEALHASTLCCSILKSKLLCTEVDSLGHHISKCGIKADPKKIKCILNWPLPKSSTEVCAFLGLICYITDFLLKLADHTQVLTPLTHTEL